MEPVTEPPAALQAEAVFLLVCSRKQLKSVTFQPNRNILSNLANFWSQANCEKMLTQAV